MTYSEKKDQFHDRVLRRIIVFLVVAAFAVPLLTPRVFAASTVSISGGDQVKGGETFTVTVTAISPGTNPFPIPAPVMTDPIWYTRNATV